MIQSILGRAIIFLGAALLSLPAAPTGIVDSTVTALGGSSWRYNYTINNPTPSLGFDEVTVYFDSTKYANLRAPIAPLGWDPLVVQPDTGIPADGQTGW